MQAKPAVSQDEREPRGQRREAKRIPLNRCHPCVAALLLKLLACACAPASMAEVDLDFDDYLGESVLVRRTMYIPAEGVTPDMIPHPEVERTRVNGREWFAIVNLFKLYDDKDAWCVADMKNDGRVNVLVIGVASRIQWYVENAQDRVFLVENSDFAKLKFDDYPGLLTFRYGRHVREEIRTLSPLSVLAREMTPSATAGRMQGRSHDGTSVDVRVSVDERGKPIEFVYTDLNGPDADVVHRYDYREGRVIAGRVFLRPKGGIEEFPRAAYEVLGSSKGFWIGGEVGDGWTRLVSGSPIVQHWDPNRKVPYIFDSNGQPRWVDNREIARGVPVTPAGGGKAGQGRWVVWTLLAVLALGAGLGIYWAVRTAR